MKKLAPPPLFRTLAILMIATMIALQALLAAPVNAAQITVRSLTLESTGAPGAVGGSTPGGVVNHHFKFSIPTAGNIGSINFKYCTTAADVGAATCEAPRNVSTTGSTLGSEAGWTGTQVVTSAGTPNEFYIRKTNSSVAPVNAAPNNVLEYTVNNITNPAALKQNGDPEPNYTFFVRISTYLSTDGTGAPIDEGTVAASTADPTELYGVMPESLIFCTGKTIPLGAGNVPNCSGADTSRVDFNQLFSATDTAWATSQMAASTNATYGYIITVNGPTLMSGTNQITPMDGTVASTHGISQFGLNLKLNTAASLGLTNDLGAEVSPAGGTSPYQGRAATGYDTSATFKYATGEVVANSNSLASDAQIYTISYIVNVPGSQPAGAYTTTLTYICTPTF